MSEPRDWIDDEYDPRLVMARVAHLPMQAQQEVEQISRIVRAAFGYDEAEMPEQGRIVTIALTGPCADVQRAGEPITSYHFHIIVNLPECAEEAHWHFSRRLIAREIGAHRPVTLRITTGDGPAGITLYDAAIDLPLNMRELPQRR